jgi:hypothetical protein
VFALAAAGGGLGWPEMELLGTCTDSVSRQLQCKLTPGLQSRPETKAAVLHSSGPQALPTSSIWAVGCICPCSGGLITLPPKEYFANIKQVCCCTLACFRVENLKKQGQKAHVPFGAAAACSCGLTPTAAMAFVSFAHRLQFVAAKLTDIFGDTVLTKTAGTCRDLGHRQALFKPSASPECELHCASATAHATCLPI